MKILVTGAKGFIGSHLVPVLRNLGDTVYTDLLLDWDKSVDATVHLAAKTHINNVFDPELIKANILLSEKIFSRPERIVYMTSCSALHLTNPYALTKMYNEFQAQSHRNAIGMRLYNVYGSGNNKGIIKHLLDKKNGDEITLRGNDSVRDYVFIEDVIKQIIQALESEFCGLRHVGTGVGTTLIDLINLFQTLAGRKFKIKKEDVGTNEPLAMVSPYKQPNFTSLEEGLIKLINNQ